MGIRADGKRIGRLRRGLVVALIAMSVGNASAQQQEAPTPGPWAEDRLLAGKGFWAQTLTFRNDYDGPVSATLIRRPRQRERACAVLYIHGYVDYFFQTHLADFYQHKLSNKQPGKGCDFFALDLRKHGRSLGPQYKYPNFAKSLDEYYPEITYALTTIQADGYGFVLLNAHSTGALTAARYLQDGHAKGVVTAAFFNSPFLDFNGRDIKWFGEKVARTIGKISPHFKRQSPVPVWYARSLLKCVVPYSDCHGHWDFNTELKPLNGFPMFLGWVRAIAIAQKKVRKRDIVQPILILRSARSHHGKGDTWIKEFRRADLVLDVKDMTRFGKMLGRNVTIRKIEGGVHDLVLSDKQPRTQVFAEITDWLRGLPNNPVGS